MEPLTRVCTPACGQPNGGRADAPTGYTLVLSTSIHYIKVHGIPFIISTDEPNAETIAALNEYTMFKQHPEKYRRYASFKEAMNEVLADDA